MSTQYRTWLERDSMLAGTCFFIMLNPSTADAEIDDPIIRRCRGFTARLGLGRLVVVNLFTARATDPAELITLDDPVGPEAPDAIERAIFHQWTDQWEDGAGNIRPRDVIVCAWGACHSKWPEWFIGMRHDRIQATLDLAEALKRPLFCLGRTSKGDPRHPLYVRSDAPLLPFGEAA